MRATAALMLLVCSAGTGVAQQVPIRQLTAPEAVVPGPFTYAWTTVRPLSDNGMVLATRGSVNRYPGSFANPVLVLDSTSSLLSRPGARPVIIPALSDTTWIVDVNSSGFLAIEPSGKIGRAIAAPKAGDIHLMSSPGTTFVDAKGRLIYPARFPRVTESSTGRTDIGFRSDSVPIVRADFNTRTVDTIAVISLPQDGSTSMVVENGRMTMNRVRHPYPMTNAWTALNDGTIVLAVGADYHLDWIFERKKTSTPKMPFDWKGITEAEKIRIIDSLKAMYAVADSVMAARATTAGANTIVQVNSWVKPSELPDYYPPIREGAVRADPEGNIWVLPTTSALAQGGLLYDVVNRKGEVFERVQFPKDCALSAIGAKGVLFLNCTNTGIERRRVVRS